MKPWILLVIIFVAIIACLANWVTNYAMYVSNLQTYGMAKFNIPLTVVCTGVIVFFIEKNGLQTRKKIQDEFDELHERLQKEKQEKEKPKDKDFTFVHPQEDPDAQFKGNY